MPAGGSPTTNHVTLNLSVDARGSGSANSAIDADKTVKTLLEALRRRGINLEGG
jgi:hypothetical protein